MMNTATLRRAAGSQDGGRWPHGVWCACRAGVIALSCLLAFSAWAVPSAGPVLDAIVAVVNDEAIPRSELERELALIEPQLKASGTELPPRDQLVKQVLDRLILKHLQAQRARQLGIEVDEATLTQALTEIASRNGLSLDELRQALRANGIDFEAFRADTRHQILVQRLRAQEIVKNIRVTPAEIDRFLAREADTLITRTEVRLQHILLALPETPAPEQIRQAEDKARDLLKRLRAGEDFAKLAVAYSDGYNALQGGDLGWFPLAEVPSLAVGLARNLKKGEVSEPLRSPSGIHLIKLVDFKGEAPAPVIQTHARHILLRPNELLSDAEAERRLSQLRQRIISGEDFAALARAHSDDTGSALKGGDLGWLQPGDTAPAFEEVLNRLEPSAVSAPFKTPFGWHLVQVLERRVQETPEAALRLKAEEALRARKADEATEMWLRRLRDEAYVEIRLGQP